MSRSRFAVLATACLVLTSLGSCSGANTPTQSAETSMTISAARPHTGDDHSPISSASGSPTSTAAPETMSPTGELTPASALLSTLTAESAPATTLPYPGGQTGREMLIRRGLINDDGMLTLRPGADGTHPVAAADACGFVFGMPGAVARAARLPEPIALAEMSGLQRSAGRNVLVCVYTADGTPVLALQATDGPPLDAEAPGDPVIVSQRSLQGSLSYAPDYDGDRLDDIQAAAWMSQALGFVTGT